jgi:hypothetical protein
MDWDEQDRIAEQASATADRWREDNQRRREEHERRTSNAGIATDC